MKVIMKSLRQLRKYGRNLGGDMNESLTYFIRMSDGSLIKTSENADESFIAVSKDVRDNGEEFLVVDHPNPISKREYEATKVLYKEEL